MLTETRWARIAPVVLVAVNLAVFLPTLLNGFVNQDDDVNVYLNPWLQWPDVGHFWAQPYVGLYAPLTYMSYALDRVVWGDDPLGYHLGNLLLHAGAALVVYGILRLFAAPLGALMGALVFSIHPVQTEAVAWVTGRRDVLAGFLSLLAIYLYVLWRRRGGRRRYALAIAFFAAALLSKPSAVVVPIIIVVFDLVIERRRLSDIGGAIAPWLALSAVCAAVLMWAQSAAVGAQQPTVSLWQRPLVASDALLFYAGRLTIPAWLAPVYGRTPSLALQGAAVFFGVALIVAGILLLAKAPRIWSAAALIFVSGLLPVLGFVPFAYQSWSTVADRYLYLSMLGAGLAVACGVTMIRCRRSLILTPIIVIFASFAVLTSLQIRVWRDSVSMWTRAVRVWPGDKVAHNSFGRALSEAGHPSRAIGEFRLALSGNSSDGPVEHNMGAAYLALGRTDEAIEHLKRAVDLAPDDALIRQNYASALSAGGRAGEALEQYERVVQLAPRWYIAHWSLAMQLVAAGRNDDAIVHLQRAVELNPNSAEARVALAVVLIRVGKVDEGMASYAAAVQAEPSRVKTYLSVARALAEAGRREQARDVCRAGLETVGDNPSAEALRRFIED